MAKRRPRVGGRVPLYMPHNEACPSKFSKEFVSCRRCGRVYIEEHEGWYCTADAWPFLPAAEQIARYKSWVYKHHGLGCPSYAMVCGEIDRRVELFSSKVILERPTLRLL